MKQTPLILTNHTIHGYNRSHASVFKFSDTMEKDLMRKLKRLTFLFQKYKLLTHFYAPFRTTQWRSSIGFRLEQPANASMTSDQTALTILASSPRCCPHQGGLASPGTGQPVTSGCMELRRLSRVLSYTAVSPPAPSFASLSSSLTFL